MSRAPTSPSPAAIPTVSAYGKLGLNYKSLISNLVAQYETKRRLTVQDKIFTAAAERWFPTLIGTWAPGRAWAWAPATINN